MAVIVFADTTGRYDGRDLERRAMGGTETSVIRMARELVRRGHDVTVVTNCDGPVTDQGVRWLPFGGAMPVACDLYVPIQHVALLGLVPKARRTAIWVLWQPNHLKHFKRLPAMWWHRPVPVLMSHHQVRIYSPFLPRRNPHIVIPLGLPDDIRGFAPLPAPPGPALLFASNPQRNLHGLVRLWVDRILPQRPDATLRIFGSMVKVADPWLAWSGNVLPADLSDAARASITITTAAPRSELVDAMRTSRAMIYFGHKCEAFCLSVAEAQALGLPCVVAPLTVLPERVIDGVTGFVRAPGLDFAEAALSLLNDDDLWRSQHEAALRLQQGVAWPEVAARFEMALLSDMIPTTTAWPVARPDS